MYNLICLIFSVLFLLGGVWMLYQARKTQTFIKECVKKYDIEHGIDFDLKFTNYIECNRTDIQNWKNTSDKLTKDLDTRIYKIEKVVFPSRRKTP